ncbi:MAG: hypothetical protein ACI4I6_10020 [Hominimerdicola sp.]
MDLQKLSLGANEIYQKLYNALKNPNGSVHPQSLLCCAGSLAGYSCQYGIRQKYVVGEGLDEDKVFMIVMSKDGEKFYFGDLLNEPVVSAKYSVWALVGGALQKIGSEMPDLNEVFQYVSMVCGSADFGKVRNCQTGENMKDYVKNLWNPMFNTAKKYGADDEIHIIFGIVLQKIIMACSQAVPARKCAEIAMESVISMSKYDLK